MTVERARAYADAGADGLFVPGLTEMSLIAQIAKASPLPLNIMVGDASPTLRALAEHGVARVSYGPRNYLTAMKALEDAARAVSTLSFRPSSRESGWKITASDDVFSTT